MADREPYDFTAVPSSRFFEFSHRSRGPDHAEITMPVKPEYVQGEGAVQGGIITALADTTGVYAIFPDLPSDRTMTSIELKVNFLRPASARAGDLTARARVVKRGQTIAVCHVDVLQEDRLVATGLFTYLIMSRGE